ncbi:MAG: alpha/beta fold hydrolase [Deltaproteobacteria bacterium]|jgi:carboxylesterase|nr:alpha/beta fold hydrolase [Deltaproteobacteria bacterium]MCW8892787.1 alpha/beta fold hydrolase [Deltaproteobacteria bacterium]
MHWFDQETNLAIQEGVSHPQNYPFFLQPDNPGNHAALLIHGFGSSPRELFPLAAKLLEQGFRVYGVRLPGHGTSPEDLAQRQAEEWLAKVEQGYLNLKTMSEKVSVVGLSTGALLALKLALHQPLEKLVLLSPFLKLQHFLAPVAGLLSFIIPYQEKEISEPERPFYYQRRPLKGIAQINRLRRQVREQLPQVTAATLVLASLGDETIARGTAEELFSRLGSQVKQFHSYGLNVPHVLTSEENPELQDVLKRCSDFLTEDDE